MNVFISWSGNRSKHVAFALRSWLPEVAHSVDPFMSDEDIDKGVKGLNTIDTKLKDSDCGVLCLTPENLNSPWINYESGALAKTIDKSNLWTYLFDLTVDGLRNANLPISALQHTTTNKDDTKKLVRSIHKRAKSSLSTSKIDKQFEQCWPELKKELDSVPAAEPARRSVEEMIADLHQYIRSTKSLGMTITSPVEGKSAEAHLAISGTSRDGQPPGQIIVAVVQSQDEFRPNEWIRIQDKKWTASVWLMKPGKNIIHIVRPNELGRRLLEYYGRVNAETKQKLGDGKGMWIGIKMDHLPPGLEVETSIEIEYTPVAPKK
jgi:hypothetical protein